MKSLKKVAKKVITNPITFLSISSFFLVILYLNSLDNNINFSVGEYISFGVTYIIVLTIFMDKELFDSGDELDSNEENNIAARQNYVSLFNFINNTKK